jgi:hypothetical protein
VQVSPPRPLSAAEEGVLRLLLTLDFPGVEELRAQIPHAMVVARCDCGCPTVELRVPPNVPVSPVTAPNRLPPVEGRVLPAADGPPADVILFVDDGRLSSLELVWYGDRPPAEWPPLDRVTAERATRK